MKAYRVAILKSDNVYTVTAKWSTDRDDTTGQTDVFGSEDEALRHYLFWMDESSRKDEMLSVEITHTIRYAVAQ